MGRKKEVKLEDIAVSLGVSIVTVSNALKGKKGVSEEMRSRILEAAETMGYQVQKEEEKRESQSFMIGVVVAERYVKEFPSFYMDIYKYVAQEVNRKGSLTVLEIVDERKESEFGNMHIFSGVEVDGIVLIGQMKKEYITRMKEVCGVPVVCVDYYDVDADMDYIITDGYNGMFQVTDYLIRLGYRSFQFVGTPQATRNIMDRYMGYCKALELHNLQCQQQNILNDRRSKGYDYQLDAEVPDKLPEVFVCNCDKIAGILAEKLEKKGIRIPENVGITGFDNFHAKLSDGRMITTYENDGKAIAQISVNTLFRRIAGKEAEGIRIVEGKLIKGNTVWEKEEADLCRKLN